jgi:glutathione S-transferase
MALPLIVKLFDSVGPNPWVVRLAFKAKGVRLLKKKALAAASSQDGPFVESYKLKVIDKVPENRHESMHAKNAAGTTPFVELEDGTCLAESVAICEYLDALYPNSGPLLTGGETILDKVRTSMWTQRISLGITQPFQRQYQYGEGVRYFKHHVPWAEASQIHVPGLRKQTTDTLEWLEKTMQERTVDTGFVAGGKDYTIPDLQLYCTAKFMGNPKVNVAKVAESFDPANTHFGPWLQDWYRKMDGIVKELDSRN